jgi:microcystin-dependent protein
MKKNLLKIITLTALFINSLAFGDAVVNAGKTWANGEEVTAVKLNQQFTSATVSAVNQNNMASSYGTVYTGASAPSDTDALWRDSGNSNIIKYYTGSAWAAVSSALTGSVVAYVSETVPSGYLECDGSAISRTTYAELFAVIGELYGQGDNSTTFNIPDFQGQFLRGWDNSAGTDPDAATRTAQATGGATGDHVGSEQGFANQAHTHSTGLVFATDEPNGGSGVAVRTQGSQATGAATGATSTEARPTNVYVMYIIKY